MGDPVPAAASIERPSVLILTKDEEINLEACLQSCVALSDDVVVLDSFSTDRTLEIIAKFPQVRLVQRKFDTWAKHSNWALTNIQYKHPWVYYSDADERLPIELRDEILRVTNDKSATHSAYRLRYKNIFRGRWIKHGGIYPVWIMRLYKPDRVRYEDREVNAHPVVDGTVGDLREHFIHYSFNKGLAPWFEKHNSYSQMEAREGLRVTGDSVSKWIGVLFTGDKNLRRRALKNISFFMPARGILRFIHVYIFTQGFLDGSAGFHYALMISMYEYWIALKIKEQRSSWRANMDKLVARLLKEPASASGKTPSANPRLEVLIPTLNESDHIAEVVANASALGKVFVLDSGSTDGTQELARKAGATVVEHRFVNYSQQKNWALDNLPFTGEWIFILDADERITPKLRDEILTLLEATPPAQGYYINRLPLIMGGTIRHGGMYPSWNLRLLKRGVCRYENRSVHEHMVCNGPTAYLRGEMLHIRRENLSRFISKHIRYADFESNEWMKQRQGQSQSAQPFDLFSGALGWRQWLRRRVIPRLPGSPIWRFIYMYIVRLGFLDGAPGIRHAGLIACYEYMIVLLYHEKIDAARLTRRRKAFDPQKP